MHHLGHHSTVLLGCQMGLDCLVPIGNRTQMPSIYRETSAEVWHYKYTAQSSHRHKKTCTVTTTVAVHHPCIDTLHTRGCTLRPMKTGLGIGCGLSYQLLLPWSPQQNTNTRCADIHRITIVQCLWLDSCHFLM